MPYICFLFEHLYLQGSYSIFQKTILHRELFIKIFEIEVEQGSTEMANMSTLTKY